MSPDIPSARVLIVDQSLESREVLRALLERSGAATIEATRFDEAASLAVRERPDLIVVDVDSDTSANHDATRQLAAAARRTGAPIVVLGKLGRRESPLEGGEYVAKPYHYGSLLRKIEDVLEHRRAA